MNKRDVLILVKSSGIGDRRPWPINLNSRPKLFSEMALWKDRDFFYWGEKEKVCSPEHTISLCHNVTTSL